MKNVAHRVFKFFRYPPKQVAETPFQIIVMFLAILVGVRWLIDRTSVVWVTYPGFLVVGLAIFLIVGGATANVARFVRSERTELAGLGFCLAALVIYFVTILVIKTDSLLAGLPYLGYLFAIYIRMRVIHLSLSLKKELRGRADGSN